MKRKRTTQGGRTKKRARSEQFVPAGTATFGSRKMFVARSLGNSLAVTERKYYDTQIVAASMAAPGTSWAGGELDPLANPAQTLFAPATGTDFNNREGRKVQVLAIKIQGQVAVPPQTNQIATDAGTIVRLHLVQDKQTNATQLNAEDVFNSGDATSAINMFQNPAFFGRFKVLKSKKWVMHNPAISWDGTNIEQGGLIKQFKITHKFAKPVVVHFNATGTETVAAIIDNSFHIIGIAESAALQPTIIYKCRTVFLDV